jgi:hypothetical protein
MTTKKKVLYFDVWVFTPFTEISLEIAEKHKEQGDEVQIVNISTKLPHWDFLPYAAEKDHYHAAQYRLEKKMEMISNFAKKNGISFISDPLLDSNDYRLTIPTDIKNVEMLKEFYWNEYDMGMGLASHMISRTHNMEPYIEKYRNDLNSVFSSSVMALDSFIKWHNQFKPDIIYIYNGRTPLNRPILRYCHKAGYDIRVVDRGGALGKYVITPTYNHDRLVMNKFIEDYWKESQLTLPEKEDIAKRYFYDRINGVSTIQFVGAQKKDLLPENFRKNDKVITFFTGSITEYAAIDKENSADILFNNQFEAVREIADYLVKTDYKFFLRVHPNTIKNYPTEYAKWMMLKSELKGKVSFIGGDHPVDSYALAKHSDKIVVHMTSLGIEAAFLGVPTIVIGNSNYRLMGSTYSPANKQEFFDLLTMDKLPPKSNTGALKYGFFLAGAGYAFKHFVYTDKWLGLYDGVDFNALESYSFKTRVVAYLLFFRDKIKANGLVQAIKIFLNKDEMNYFRKNPIPRWKF